MTNYYYLTNEISMIAENLTSQSIEQVEIGFRYGLLLSVIIFVLTYTFSEILVRAMRTIMSC